jgi:hypothetical protein
MRPDDNARAYAESIAPARTEDTSPALHATEEMRRLATPWLVAVAKAQLLRSCKLSPGIILDPACGSGTQLAALCSTLNRPGLGVELSGAVAPLSAVNLERCGESSIEDWYASSRILWGDGTAAATIMQAYHSHIEQNPGIALLHVDPARPNDTQQHTLDEMQPRLDDLLTSWAPYLGKSPAIVLDVSPRLLDTQRCEIEAIVSAIWGEVPMTWQWLTQGRGRIDRLSLWIGAAAGAHPCRLVRLTKSGDIHLLEGPSNPSLAQPSKVNIGEHLVIADPCLIASDLGESWKASCANEEGRWQTISGRRPIFISTTQILAEVSDTVTDDSSTKMAQSMIQAAGEVVATISSIDETSIPEFVKLATNVGISSLKLRCTLAPDLQPKLQSKIDREMKTFGTLDAAKSGFITEVSDGYAICKEYD